MSISSVTKPSQLRRKEILKLLGEREHCTIVELTERFGVSVPTIYRDVDALVKTQQASKTHGGIKFRPGSAAKQQPATDNFEIRLHRQLKAKKEIARKALALLEEDDVVFFDSSTTVLHLAREVTGLRQKRLTVITNSGPVINEFPSFPPSITLIQIGGIYHAQLHSFLGGIAMQTVEALRINKVFFSAVGFTASGAFTFHEDHAAFLKRLMERCKGVFLADSSKFGREALFKICEWRDIDTFVGDSSLPSQALEFIKKSVSTVL